MGKQFTKKNNILEPRINHELKRYETVRLIYNGKDGENGFNKIVTMNEAFELSKEYSLDLVEINAKAVPPIVRLCDYSKYLFELKKKIKAKNKNTTVCKEIQLSVNIGRNDLEIKVNKARKFLEDNNKVRVVLTMRGRELGRRELSKECFNQFMKMVSDVAAFESEPKDEGNKVIAILKKK